MPTPIDHWDPLIPETVLKLGSLEDYLDAVVPGWATARNLEAINEVLESEEVALGFAHNQVIQIGTLRVEEETAHSTMMFRQTYANWFRVKKLVSVTTASGSKHPVELGTLYHLVMTRRVIRAREDAQRANERAKR
ncbi:unnamed protein product [Caenorhabditis brenneri]